MLAKKTSKNQLTLPKAIVSRFPNVEYYDVTTENDAIVLRPVRTGAADAVREKLDSLGIKEADIEYAIRWARRKR
ncbi:MAG: AbrB/MazE/SpoVT family DNA-binding domain-containing protein [Gammaproteobacteria bacterium]